MKKLNLLVLILLLPLCGCGYFESDNEKSQSIYGNGQDYMLQDYNLKEVTSYKNFVLEDQDFSGPENVTGITESAVVSSTEEVINEDNTIADNPTNVGEGESATIAVATDISKYDLIFPVDLSGGAKFTSYFGARTSPTAGASTNHKGLDIGCSANTNIYAAADGTVTFAGYSSSCGNYVIVTHGKDAKGRVVTTTYMHNSELKVSAGQKVKRGDILALAGSTGYSTGVHCHFQLQLDGVHYNPVRSFNLEKLKAIDNGERKVVAFNSIGTSYTMEQYKQNLYFDGNQYQTVED